ncbi:MAG: L7Ae/L30e/S12e/Gadd45 family ribosomal protein [Solirubrobacterales bacterium]
MKKNIYQMIGLACKAGKVSSGAMAAKTSITRKRAQMLILSQDISEKTKEGLIAACERKNVPWLMLGDKYRLGAHVGKAYRVALTINDPGFADAIFHILAELPAQEANDMGVVEWRK